ncbi:MAG: AmmeMemoRadiSam system radical SAM enzyme [Candidatus Thorarchaeota archaeon]|nr:AmmeMemoRadiSam system radical SAM enzyme [Candidatus Thorarchaeota archaeon]
MMREATLYSNLKQGIRCDLCARRCVLHDGETGFCRVRVVKDGKLYTKVYGLIDGMAADPIEKKPLFHFAPGSHAFSISTSSCNFRCQFCLNYHSAHREVPAGEMIMPEEIVHLAERHNCAGITYTYTEPTVFMELAHDTAEIAHNKGMFNTFVTNGYLTKEAIDYIAPYLDAASVNFKGSGNKKFYNDLMSVPKVEPIFTAMDYMNKKGILIEITNLIIPEVGDHPEDTEYLAKWTVEHLGPRTAFHVTAFSPTYKLTHIPRTSAKMLEKHIAIAKEAGLEFVYSGNIPGHDYENTYCPECGYKVIERHSVYLKSNNLNEQGLCPQCNANLNISGIQWMVRGKGQLGRF